MSTRLTTSTAVFLVVDPRQDDRRADQLMKDYLDLGGAWKHWLGDGASADNASRRPVAYLTRAEAMRAARRRWRAARRRREALRGWDRAA